MSCLREETGVPVHVAEEPLACVAEGSGRFLEEIGLYRALYPQIDHDVVDAAPCVMLSYITSPRSLRISSLSETVH